MTDQEMLSRMREMATSFPQICGMFNQFADQIEGLIEAAEQAPKGSNVSPVSPITIAEIRRLANQEKGIDWRIRVLLQALDHERSEHKKTMREAVALGCDREYETEMRRQERNRIVAWLENESTNNEGLSSSTLSWAANQLGNPKPESHDLSSYDAMAEKVERYEKALIEITQIKTSQAPSYDNIHQSQRLAREALGE